MVNCAENHLHFFFSPSPAGSPGQAKLRAPSWSSSTWQRSAVSSLSRRSSDRYLSPTPYWKVWRAQVASTSGSQEGQWPPIPASAPPPSSSSVWKRQNHPQWQLQSLRQVFGDLLQSEWDDSRRSRGAVSSGEVSRLLSGDPNLYLPLPENAIWPRASCHTVILGNKDWYLQSKVDHMKCHWDTLFWLSGVMFNNFLLIYSLLFRPRGKETTTYFTACSPG